MALQPKIGKTTLDIISLRPNTFILAVVTNEIVRDSVKAAKEIIHLNDGDLVAVVGGLTFETHKLYKNCRNIKYLLRGE